MTRKRKARKRRIKQEQRAQRKSSKKGKKKVTHEVSTTTVGVNEPTAATQSAVGDLAGHDPEAKENTSATTR